MSEPKGTPQFDIAIVGGGISGVYSGWRLLTADLARSPILKRWAGAGGKLKVGLFEGSQRIGGRLLSARPPGMPHVTCEIGGMRYVSSQTLVRSLVENELKLPRKEQVVDQPSNIAFLRGRSLRYSELSDPEMLPYDLSPAESEWLLRNNTPSALIGWAISQLVPEAQNLSGEKLREYLRSATVDGTPLYQHGFWNLIARSMSPEAYQLARTTVGYDCLGWNANAVDLTAEYYDFTPGVKYYLIDGGYDLVPWTLEARFLDAGGTLTKGAWLSGFDAATLDDGSTGVSLHFHDDRPPVTARAILLAMPRRSIEMLRPDGPVLDPRKAPRVQFLLDSVKPVPLYKLTIAYAFPWWESFGVKQGRSLTDIPVRQCYYWAVEGEQPGADPSNHNAVIMAYNDARSVDFWGSLRRLPVDESPVAEEAPWLASRKEPPAGHGPKARAFRRKPMPFSQGQGLESNDEFARRLRQNWDDHNAPHEMVIEMHRQLMSMHSAQYAPEPLEAAYMDWSDDPYGGGVHFWNPGYQSWVVLEDMTQPVPDFPCYVCGEAFSTNQTWAEGALQTAEIVLQKRLGIPAPGWVTTS